MSSARDAKSPNSGRLKDANSEKKQLLVLLSKESIIDYRCKSVIPGLGRVQQENCKFKGSLGCIVNGGQPRLPVLKDNKQKQIWGTITLVNGGEILSSELRTMYTEEGTNIQNAQSTQEWGVGRSRCIAHMDMFQRITKNIIFKKSIRRAK